MQKTASGDDQDALQSVLRLLATAVKADGIVLYTTAVPLGELLVTDSLPSGLVGKHTMPGRLLGLPEAAGTQEIISTEDLLLPSAITRMLGARPAFVCSMLVTVQDSKNYIFLWWKQHPGKEVNPVNTLRSAQALLEAFMAQSEDAGRLQRVEQQLDAILSNITLGLVFIDSLRGSRLNPIAANILHIAADTQETSQVAAAMQELRASCTVTVIDENDPTTGSARNNISIAEYWISHERGLALRVESHSVGAMTTPERFWVFTDVKPLWESSEKLRTANEQLYANVSQLAAEVERRVQAEAELLRYNVGLRQQNQKLEVAKLESDLLANQDPLTGLSNRRYFHRALNERIDANKVKRDRIAVLFIDLDKFKSVNDTLGHDRGDDLLRAVATTLVKSLRGEDLIARLGGDEFACATTFARELGIDPIIEMSKRVCRALQIPVPSPERTIFVCATIGIAFFPEDAGDAESLLGAADKAMYLGKRRGGNEAVFFGINEKRVHAHQDE